MTPTAWTSNNGPYPEDYPVRMKIVNESDSVVYDTTAPVIGHVPPSGKLVSFPTWHADQPGEYVVTCSTELAGDGVPANDKHTDTCEVLYPYDVSADRIFSPLRVGYYEELTPGGVVSNHYDQELTFLVKFVIGTVYGDSFPVTVPALDSQGFNFRPCTQLPTGTHVMKLIVRLDGDVIPANDTFSASLEVVDSDYWVKLPSAPTNGLVLVDGPDADQTVYGAQPTGSSFEKFSVPGNEWNPGGIPPSSSPLVVHYSADRYGDYIFVLGLHYLGWTPAIARYTISGDSWDIVTTTLQPGAAEHGGIFARHEDTLYVLLRETQRSFFRYVISSNSWTWLAKDPPLGSTGLAASTYDGTDLVHVLQAEQLSPPQRCWLQTYSISGDSWWTYTPMLDHPLADTGTAITTIPGRNSVFALWPTSLASPSGGGNFFEIDISVPGNMWESRWPYFAQVGRYPSMTSRDGLVYAYCDLDPVNVFCFGRYYPIPVPPEGVCAVVGARVTEYGLNSVPNPFVRGTTIRWQVPKATRALVAVYDAQGRLVKKLHDGSLEPGRYSQVWNTRGMPAGVYLCSFTSSERRMTQRLILMK